MIQRGLFFHGRAAAVVMAAMLALLTPAMHAAPDVEKRWSIPFTPPMVPQADIMSFDPANTNLGPLPSDSVYQGKVYQYLSTAPNEKPVTRFAAYPLRAGVTGRYALFAATNVQWQNFSSPLQFRFNQQDWHPVPEPVAGTLRWGVSNAMAWTCLGTFDLRANEPATLEISGDRPRAMDGRVAIYLNGVIGYRIDALRPVQISALQVDKKELAVGQSLAVVVESPKPEETRGLVAEVRYGTSIVAQDLVRVERSADGKEVATATLQIPFDAPQGDYQVGIQPLFFQQMSKSPTVPVKVQSAYRMPASRGAAVQIKHVQLTDVGHVMVQLAAPSPTDAMLGVWYMDSRDYLLAAQDEPIAAGKNEAQVALTGARWQQRGAGHLQIFVHGSSAPAVRMDLPVVTEKASVKPMSHGIFADDASISHRWYVTDDHTLIWDGKPWIPFGGMYCDPVLSFFQADPTVRQQRWQEREKSLDAIQQAGISAMYINLGHGPVWAKQTLVNELTRRGVYFGWQLNDSSNPFDCYPVRSSIKQGLCIGQVHDKGKLEVELPRETISGLLTVAVDQPSQVRSIDIAMDFNQPGALDFIVMDLAADQKKGFVKVRVDIPDLAPGSYYVLPRMQRSGHMINVWEKEPEIVASHEWIREMKWGPNLRFLIDPTINEGGIYNGDESLRVWSPMLNAEFAQWLSERYTTISALENAWCLPAGSISSFEQAARLLPLRERSRHVNTMLWIDPMEQKTLATAGGLGSGWYDYNEAARISYARHRDRIAQQIRQWVNVPIVFKRVTPWVCDENINRDVGGMNGIGVDIYSDQGSKLSSGLTSGSMEANLGAQTIWLMGAELGYNPNPGNGNVRGFPSADYVRDLTRVTAAWGLKGFMYFGLRLEPYNLWGAMQLYSVPEQLQWIREVQADITNHWPAPAVYAQCYPDGQSWWWRAGGEMLTKYSCVYDGAPGAFQQTFPLIANPDESQAFVAVNASQHLDQAKMLVVNFRDAEAVRRFGSYVQERLKTGTPIIYMGNWPIGARLEGLSEHFAPEGHSLAARPGDMVLARDAHVVMAKRNGKLLLVAGEFKLPGSNSTHTMKELKQEWIESLLRAP